ncbi:L,D-transpeptidase [Streptomyces sp. BV286]|uniref:L,D-transpeptidase n=1 Tax=Streptomyces sp. BV286 TaxID=2849672 RepID=UPI001C2EFBC6|nr:L,D-transpeptidase [Streptomyces sp. BV286]MBV1937843.1 L,D-transpeptidase [Streptomyces sp. BV286]
MSDELTPGRRHPGEDPGVGPAVDPGGSELTVALHELAQRHETPVPVAGAEIRRRAVGRRRRRRAALATAGAAGAGALALVLTVAFTGGGDTRSTPPAASSARTPPATPELSAAPVAATVDLSRRELTAEGRTLPISSGRARTPTPTGLMTVTAKYPTATVPGQTAGFGEGKEYDLKTTWVMTLRGPDGRTNYLLALSWNEKAPGGYDITGGAIGLRSDDAMWLYKELRPGSVVQVLSSAPATPSARSGASAAPPETVSPTAPALQAPPVASATARPDPRS